MLNDDTTLSADELIRRARIEAQRRRLESGNGFVDDVPGEQRPGSLTLVHQTIAAAEQHAVVGGDLPPMHAMQGLRRRIAVPLGKLILRAARLFTAQQTSFNQESVGALRALSHALTGHLRALTKELAETTRAQEARTAALAAEEARLRGALEERLTESISREAERREAALQEAVAALRREETARIDAVVQGVASDAARLRTLLAQQERRVSVLLEAARRSGADGSQTVGDVAGEELDRLLDSFYSAFEDQFRGSREEIRRRALPYLDVVREAAAGTPTRPIVDLGCGRGEWLELLAEHGLTARGVDANRVAVDENRRRGLDVIEGDALAYLRALPDRSCGAVTGLHLLEHLPFPVMLRLLDESVRVLGPGGVAVFETPNPQNLLVGACRFYVDPTHRNPLHPDTLAFIAEARGLVRVAVRYLHPVDEEARFPEDGSPALQRLNHYLYGPQDFAVIGYRP